MKGLYCLSAILILLPCALLAQDDPTIRLPPSDTKSEQSPKSSEEKMAIIELTVDRSGVVQKSALIQSSGNSETDNVAIDAMKQMKKIKPIPENVLPEKQLFKVQIPINVVP